MYIHLLAAFNAIFFSQDIIETYQKKCDDAYTEAKAQTVTYNRLWIDSPWEKFFDSRDPMNLPSTGIEESQLSYIGEISMN